MGKVGTIWAELIRSKGESGPNWAKLPPSKGGFGPNLSMLTPSKGGSGPVRWSWHYPRVDKGRKVAKVCNCPQIRRVDLRSSGHLQVSSR